MYDNEIKIAQVVKNDGTPYAVAIHTYGERGLENSYDLTVDRAKELILEMDKAIKDIEEAQRNKRLDKTKRIMLAMEKIIKELEGVEDPKN